MIVAIKSCCKYRRLRWKILAITSAPWIETPSGEFWMVLKSYKWQLWQLFECFLSDEHGFENFNCPLHWMSLHWIFSSIFFTQWCIGIVNFSIAKRIIKKGSFLERFKRAYSSLQVDFVMLSHKETAVISTSTSKSIYFIQQLRTEWDPHLLQLLRLMNVTDLNIAVRWRINIWY